MRGDPVLLPPEERGRRPLGGWVAVVALAGLALLVCSTVPAVLRRTRLARDLDRLQGQVEAQEQEVLRLERQLGAARTDTFAFEQALRRLVHPPPLRQEVGVVRTPVVDAGPPPEGAPAGVR